MDRRKFIKAVPAASLVGITGASTRLYGQPSSVIGVAAGNLPPAIPHMFRLHLAVQGVNIQYADCCSIFAQLASDIMADASVAQTFAADPDTYISNLGLPPSTFVTTSPEFMMVLGLADPSVRAAAGSGDTIAFLNAISVYTAANPVDTALPSIRSVLVNANTLVNLSAILNVAAALNAVVAVNGGALVTVVALLLIVAIAIVYGVTPFNDPTTSVACALGGTKFANDVMRQTAIQELQGMIQAAQNGTWTMPPGLDPQDAATALQGLIDQQLLGC